MGDGGAAVLAEALAVNASVKRIDFAGKQLRRRLVSLFRSEFKIHVSQTTILASLAALRWLVRSEAIKRCKR